MRSNIARTWPASSVPAAVARPLLQVGQEGDGGGELLRAAAPRTTASAAVGLTSVRAIPSAGSRAPMWVSSGPGPSLPLSPILWQASQPDCGDDGAADVELRERLLALRDSPAPAA